MTQADDNEENKNIRRGRVPTQQSTGPEHRESVREIKP